MNAPTIDELKSFTLQSYVKLLKYLIQIYKIVPVCEIPKDDIPYLILRHDIDNSLSAALKMARIERDLGIKSTYFVLFSSRFYNVLEGNNVFTLKQISKLGHEVGLHYDVSRYQSYGKNLKQTFKIEIRLLEHLIGRKVYSISRHNPSGKDPFAIIKGIINADDPRLRDMYVYEGCRAWTLRNLCKLLNYPPKRCQLLIHPGNWQEDKIDRYALLERHFKNLEKENLQYKKRLKHIWRTAPAVIEYDALVKEGNFMQLHYQRRKSDSTTRGRLRQMLNDHDRTFLWYLSNTTFGSYLYGLKMRIYRKFKQSES